MCDEYANLWEKPQRRVSNLRKIFVKFAGKLPFSDIHAINKEDSPIYDERAGSRNNMTSSSELKLGKYKR